MTPPKAFPKDFLDYAQATVGAPPEVLSEALTTRRSLTAGKVRNGALNLLRLDGLSRFIEPSFGSAAVEVASFIKSLGFNVRFSPCPRCGRETPRRSIAPSGTFKGSHICSNCYHLMTIYASCPVCGDHKQLVRRVGEQRVCSGCAPPRPREVRECGRCGKSTTQGPVQRGIFLCMVCAYQRTVMCSWCHSEAILSKRIGASNCCVICYPKVTRTYAPCPRCKEKGIIAYPFLGYVATCASCSGVEKQYICSICKSEEHRDGKLCGRCAVKKIGDLAIAQAGGDYAYWSKFFEGLSAGEKPRTTAQWLRRSSVARDIQILLSEAPPSPKLFRQFTPPRATYLRQLTSLHLDLQHDPLDLLEDLRESLASDLHGTYLREFNIFFNWQVRRKFLGSRAYTVQSAVATSSTSMRATQKLLLFLERENVNLDSLNSANWIDFIDRFPSKASSLYSYYSWKCGQDKTLRSSVDFPVSRKEPTGELSPEAHMTAVRVLVASNDLELEVRTAGLLLAVYAQPISKIVALRLESLTTDELGRSFIALGQTPLETSGLLLELLQSSAMRARSRSDTKESWLFPGKYPGTHIGSSSIANRLRKVLNVPPSHLKRAALRHLSMGAPPTIVAGITGYGVAAVETRSRQYSQRWSSYPALRLSH